MADIKTAEEWKVVQTELAERLTSLKAEEQTLVNQIEQQRYYGRINLGTLQQLANIRQQITDNTASYDIATNQVEIAVDAPQGTRANPTTSSNTPPVNPEPGNNTDLLTTGTTAFELVNEEPETITDPFNGLTIDTVADVPVNAELPVIDDQEADLLQAQREEAAAIAGNQDPVISDEEADLLEIQREEAAAIGLGEQQKQITINTQGLPVLAEDGSVAQGVAINPETGETFFTGAGPGTNTIVTSSENTSVATGTNQARNNANALRETQFPEALDWRVRISLAPSATYLYNDAKEGDILFPLKGTRGVLFPYTPQISVSYNANYDATDLAHTNYKIYNYKNSSVDSINISGDFTAQDVNEANYVLAVIHFFRCVTKMFYGQDENPIRGVPPPLVYLTGYGQYGFDNHPMVINNFSLNYPTDVDYINAGYNLSPFSQTNYTIPNLSPSISKNRLSASKLSPGGTPTKPNFSQQATTQSITRVPTKLQIQITALPIVTRYDISNNFSLRDYAKGKLLQGSKRASGGGIW